jgi:drug/metabolite transporter (DMT)-like permease
MNPTLAMLVAALLWSGGGIGVKSASGTALAIAGWRAVFAAPVLGIAAVIEARRRKVAEPWSLAKRPLTWAAAFSYATMVVCYVVATKLTTAANSILIQYTGPAWIALLSGPVLGERVRLADAIAVGACFVGMLLFFGGGLSAEGIRGNLVAVMSSFGFAGVPILMRLELKRHPASADLVALSPYVAMTLGNLVAAGVCAPSMMTSPLDAKSFAVVAALGILQIGVAYVFYGVAVGRLSALRSSLLACIEPVLNPLWVLLLYAERPSGFAIVGGALIIGAIALQAIGKR